MYAITIRQPYAQLIVLGYKQREYRDWVTSYRGPLVIHSSRIADNLSPHEAEFLKSQGFDPANLPRQALLGTVMLRKCGRSDFSSYRHIWHLSDPKPFATPIPYKGDLGLWEVPDEILTQLPFPVPTTQEATRAPCPAPLPMPRPRRLLPHRPLAR